MKIGLISDIHGNSPALKAVLSVLWQEVEHILFLGDLCGYYPFVNECAALWKTDRMNGIQGNHDQMLLTCLHYGITPPLTYTARYGSALTRCLQTLSVSTLSLLQSLPVARLLTLDGVTLALYHGAPWDPLEGRVYPDFDGWDQFTAVAGDIILLGHTHHPFFRRHRKKLIVNPGSVGQPRDRDSRACFAILDLESGAVQHHRVPFNPQRLIEDAQQHDPNVPYLANVLIRR